MTSNIPQIAITSQGRSRAMELLSQSHYAGAAPVSLESYIEQTRKQSVKNVEVHAADIKRAFAHLVIGSEMLRQFGTALNSGSSVFLYGPAGVGKTTIAETLSRVLAEDEVWIPYAVEVDGQIITVYDQAIHKRAPESEPENHDERWVLCHRPAVLVGGELTAEMLDLQFNAITKFYVGPVQMKANNGVLIIDDFGRQRLRPEELLNRWVVPLDRRIDFLTLSGGKKIEIPFEMLIVFATNMDPADLVDAAFLRRIQTKIKVGAVSDEQFCEIFRRVAAEQGVKGDEGICNNLIDFIRGTLNQELRSCYPRDIVNQICWAARYEGRKPYLDRAALVQAVEAYFLQKA
jgi:predicted ATPase with chaperone activity